MFEKSLGVDIGYGFVKAYDGESEIIFPSVVGLGQKLSFLSNLSNYKSFLENLSIEYNGRKYFIGDYAIRQSAILSRSMDINRPEDINTLLLFITTLGLYSNKEQKFNIITGLPTSYISSYREQLENVLGGYHTVYLSLKGNREEKNIFVSNIKVVPQPFGTLFNQALSNDGKITGENIANKKVGIVDIGYKTADFVVSDNLEFVDKSSSSTTFGMAGAYQMIAAEIRSSFKIDKKDYELDKIIRQKELKIAGREHSIDELVTEAFQSLASKIKTELDSLWDYRELDSIILTGGGGEALSEYLIPKFNNMQLAKDAQFSNVRGFWKLAQHIFNITKSPSQYSIAAEMSS